MSDNTTPLEHIIYHILEFGLIALVLVLIYDFLKTYYTKEAEQ